MGEILCVCGVGWGWMEMNWCVEWTRLLAGCEAAQTQQPLVQEWGEPPTPVADIGGRHPSGCPALCKHATDLHRLTPIKYIIMASPVHSSVNNDIN